MKKLMIIGSGIAGVSAAHSARAEYPEADISLYSAEPYPFYNKIALNSYITGHIRRDHLGFYPMGSLEEKRIIPHIGHAAESIDPGAHQVIMDNGDRIDYDTLILATGADSKLPRIDGIGENGVFGLWTLSDAMEIRAAMVDARTVFILGAGILGVEIAIALIEAGKNVILAGSGDRVLPRQLNHAASAVYRRFLVETGIDLHPSRQVNRIERHQGGLRISAEGGESWDADAMLVLAGADPDTRLARSSGIECSRGILVNHRMETSHPDILACGNCTELEGVSSLLWNSAMNQGEIAGRNAFERRHDYDPAIETIHIKTPDIPMFTCGPNEDVGEDEIEFVDGKNDGYRSIRIDSSGRLLSAIFVRNVHGAFDVERGIRGGLKIPDEIRAAGDIDGIIGYLAKPPRLDLYSGRAWVCRMCGYVYEGDDPPEICPVCAVGKDQFLAA